MRLRFIALAIMLAAAIVLTSCNATDKAIVSNPTPVGTPKVPHADGVDRVSTEEVESLIKQGKAYIVDVRNQDSYELGHIPGSVLIPAGQILDHVNKLPRDKVIITYCS